MNISLPLFLFQDFGYPQTTSTEVLKSYVFNEPIVIDAARLPPLGPAAMFMVSFIRLILVYSNETNSHVIDNDLNLILSSFLHAHNQLLLFLNLQQGSKRMPGTAVTKSVVANEPGGRKREEIFVDIIEKISVTFSSSVSKFSIFSRSFFNKAYKSART